MRFKLHLLLLAGLCTCVPAATAALSYTGALGMAPGNVRLCADASNDLGGPLVGESLLFTAVDIWNITRTSPLSIAQTDGAGHACVRANLPAGVYEAQAFGAGLASQPVAITVSSGYPPNSIVTSATLSICEPGQTQSRLVTLAQYYVYTGPTIWVPGVPISYLYFPQGRTEQLLLLDPDHPGGAVRVRMRGFQQAYVRYTPAMSAIDLRFTGYCEFTVGDAKPVTKICEFVMTTPGRFRIDLDVYDYRWKSIYHAGGFPTLYFPE